MTDPIHSIPQRVCIDETRRIADLTIGWLLENEHAARSHPIRPDNELDVRICGEDAFAQIARDIEAARSTIDIIAWGFDPAMELVRSSGASEWPRGPTYGELLLKAARDRKVRVRLLVWYEAGLAAAKQNNLPGYTGNHRSGWMMGRPRTSAEAAATCK